MNKNLLAYLSCLIYVTVFSQLTPSLSWPIDTPHIITGNYGELRPNHFHAGIDFSTNGKIGFPVYAVSDGYVSRVKISAAGYGKALYLTHTNANTVSVYAHLNVYAGTIADYVKKEQIYQQTYELELYPETNTLKIRKGDLLGYSGNTGSSSGPHLHFEIRDRVSEVPLNPLYFYTISDTIKPLINAVGFYDLSDTIAPRFVRSFKVKNDRDTLQIEKDSITTYHGVLGLAFSGFDRFAPKGNPNGIYSTRLYLDGRLVFAYSMEGIAFDEQAYVNEFAENIHKTKFQKCFLPTLYPPIYKSCVNKGRIVLSDTNYHSIKVEVLDESMNKNTLEFFVRTKKVSGFVKPDGEGAFVNCAYDYNSDIEGIRIIIPAKTFYSSNWLKETNLLEKSGELVISPARINLRNSVRVGFKVPSKFKKYNNKLVLENKGLFYLPVWRDDSLLCQVRSLGVFKLRPDTVPPQVKTALSSKKIKKIRTMSSFSFLIFDNMSGILNYKLYINGQWVLAEYDAKARLLTYFFDGDTPPGNLNFLLEVGDKVGNITRFKYVLKR